MIEIKEVSKAYEGHKALDALSLSMKEGEVFGMVGTNGAGKTTLLRIMTGVLRSDAGEVLIDELPVWDNPKAKEKFFFISEEPYFFANCRAENMASYYAGVYPEFSTGEFHTLMERFGLDAKRRVNSFSKGMKRQLSIILGLASNTKYLICDETFDGLDPVMRQATKSLMARAMTDRGLTVIMTSHNLRELEDICDHVGLLHQGGVLLSKDMESLKIGVQKVQAVFESEEQEKAVAEKLEIIDHRSQGRLQVYTVREEAEKVEKVFAETGALWYEMLPLTLEEIFICETEVVGYDIQKIIGA